MQKIGFDLGCKWLIAEKLTKISLQRALAGCGVKVGLNLILIPRYGITGAAIAAIAAHTTSGYLFDIVHRETWTSFNETRSLTFLGFFR